MRSGIASGERILSYIHLEARQYDRAVAAALKAVTLESAAPLAHFLLGRAYARVGDVQSAMAALTEAARLAWPVPLFEANLGYACARAGHYAPGMPRVLAAGDPFSQSSLPSAAIES